MITFEMEKVTSRKTVGVSQETQLVLIVTFVQNKMCKMVAAICFSHEQPKVESIR